MQTSAFYHILDHHKGPIAFKPQASSSKFYWVVTNLEPQRMDSFGFSTSSQLRVSQNKPSLAELSSRRVAAVTPGTQQQPSVHLAYYASKPDSWDPWSNIRWLDRLCGRCKRWCQYFSCRHARSCLHGHCKFALMLYCLFIVHIYGSWCSRWRWSNDRSYSATRSFHFSYQRQGRASEFLTLGLVHIWVWSFCCYSKPLNFNIVEETSRYSGCVDGKLLVGGGVTLNENLINLFLISFDRSL